MARTRAYPRAARWNWFVLVLLLLVLVLEARSSDRGRGGGGGRGRNDSSWRAPFVFPKALGPEPLTWVRCRESVLDCGSPLPLLRPHQIEKRQGTGAVQNLA